MYKNDTFPNPPCLKVEHLKNNIKDPEILSQKCLSSSFEDLKDPHKIHYFITISPQKASLPKWRIRKYYIRKLRLTRDPKYEKLFSTVPPNILKKYMKLIYCLELIISGDHLPSKYLNCFRQAKRLDFRQISVFEPKVMPKKLFEIISYNLSKRSRALSFHLDQPEISNAAALEKLLQRLKFKPIKEFSFGQSIGFSPWCNTHTSLLRKIPIVVSRLLSRMPWLEYFRFLAFLDFVAPERSYFECLNKLKEIKEIPVTKFSAMSYNFRQVLGDNRITQTLNTYFKWFNCFKKLEKFSLELNNISALMLSRVIMSTKYLKFLQISFISDPSKLKKTWTEIKNLENLEFLSIIYNKEDSEDDIESAVKNKGLIPAGPIGHLQKLKRLFILTNISTKRYLFHPMKLSSALACLSELAFLKIHMYFRSKDLQKLLEKTTDKLTKLEELELDIECFEEFNLNNTVINWFETKPGIKYLTLKIGTSINFFHREFTRILGSTLENLCQGISKLNQLRELIFELGVMRYESSVVTSFKLQKEETHILSTFLKRMSHIRKISFLIGSGYLTDSELKRLLSAVKNRKGLYSFKMEGNFGLISGTVVKDLVEALKEIKLRSDIKEFKLVPVHWINIKALKENSDLLVKEI